MIRDLENNIINLRDGANGHRLLLGETGSGKTWFCYRMLEDALAQDKTCLIFDYSGSFTDKEMKKGDFQRSEQVYSVAEETGNGEFLYVGRQFYSIMAEALTKTLSITAYRQKRLLNEALHSLEKRNASVTIAGIMEELETSVQLTNKDAERHRDQLLNKLSGYAGINFIFKEASQKAEDVKTLCKPITIIQLSGHKDSERCFLADLMTKLVWQEIKEGTYHIDCIVYDEFQWMSLKKRSALSEMLREGRKCDLGVWLASQFLPEGKKEEKDTLLQASSVFIFLLSEPSQPEAAKIIEYGAWKEWVDILFNLGEGQFVLKGNYTVNNGITVGTKPIICKAELK